MRAVTVLLLLAMTVPVVAQEPAEKRLAEPDPIYSVALREPDVTITLADKDEQRASRSRTRRFWVGLVLVSAGVIVTSLAVSSERVSDLSKEHPDARLGVHLAPCGTKANETSLAIADCKPNGALLGVGVGLMGAGTGLLLTGPLWAHHGPSVGFKVRF